MINLNSNAQGKTFHESFKKDITLKKRKGEHIENVSNKKFLDEEQQKLELFLRFSEKYSNMTELSDKTHHRVQTIMQEIDALLFFNYETTVEKYVHNILDNFLSNEDFFLKENIFFNFLKTCRDTKCFSILELVFSNKNSYLLSMKHNFEFLFIGNISLHTAIGKKLNNILQKNIQEDEQEAETEREEHAKVFHQIINEDTDVEDAYCSKFMDSVIDLL